MAKADNEKFLALARDAYIASTSFIDSNYRRKWNDAFRHAQNKHHGGSKYHKPIYQYRSKGFIPKTRSAINQSMATAMRAFFSNQDLVSVNPVDINNPAQAASALINKELLQYRLTKTIPWFKICLGGIQSAHVTGAVVSYQHWVTETVDEVAPKIDPTTGYPAFDPGTGEPILKTVKRVIKDQPVIDLRPIENIRFSPAADWLDPINTSPYLIDILPMFVIDIEAKMGEINQKTGEPRWTKYDRGELAAANKHTYDSTEQSRSGGNEDPYNADKSSTLGAFDTVFVHRNFIRYGRNDYVFYTVGTELMLSKPVPIEDVYWHGERPYSLGSMLIEAHKAIPDSPTHLISDLQKTANEISNQRRDNVQLVLNKRYLARRGAQVDYKSLTRNAPGSVTLVNDPAGDITPIDFQDVTGSAYQEQDRVNMDIDDLTGVFSASSVGSNRSLGETVGGMSMLRSAGNEIAELMIRTVAETWVERVMKQLVMLEQKYESDAVLLAIAAQQAKIYERFGMSESIDTLLEQELTTTVNMGMDATDPLRKTEKLLYATGKVNEILMNPTQGLNKPEIIKEIFGSLGYKDGERFYGGQEGPPPEVQQMQQQMQMMQQAMQQMQAELQNREADRQAKAAIAEADRQFKAMQLQAQMQDKEQERQLKSGQGGADRAAGAEDTEKKIAADLIKTKYVQENENKRMVAQVQSNLIDNAIKRAHEIEIHSRRERERGANLGRRGQRVFEQQYR